MLKLRVERTDSQIWKPSLGQISMRCAVVLHTSTRGRCDETRPAWKGMSFAIILREKKKRHMNTSWKFVCCNPAWLSMMFPLRLAPLMYTFLPCGRYIRMPVYCKVHASMQLGLRRWCPPHLATRTSGWYVCFDAAWFFIRYGCCPFSLLVFTSGGRVCSNEAWPSMMLPPPISLYRASGCACASMQLGLSLHKVVRPLSIWCLCARRVCTLGCTMQLWPSIMLLPPSRYVLMPIPQDVTYGSMQLCSSMMMPVLSRFPYPRRLL